MESTDLETWEDLLSWVERLETEGGELKAARHSTPSELLFRGQSMAAWSLATTLERCAPAIKTFAEYYRLVTTAKPQIEALTAHRWELGEFKELELWANEYDRLLRADPPGYEFLAYLRHHGFPSPLLDWSRSVYIAAYFAFLDAAEDRVAIYVYWEDRGWGKVASSNAPQILSLGPYVRAHPRHYIQQSSYTVAWEFGKGPWKFARHEQVHNAGPNDQDRLWKVTLPASERTRVLRKLDAANINPYSLFQTEEALMQTIANRELLLREN